MASYLRFPDFSTLAANPNLKHSTGKAALWATRGPWAASFWPLTSLFPLPPHYRLFQGKGSAG